MFKHFNTTGPVIADEHYCIDPMQRIDWEDVQFLIQAKKFFVLHAPRQTGKTSTLLAMVDVLNASGQYTAMYMNVESAQTARHDVSAGMTTILGSLTDAASYRLNDIRLQDWRPELWERHGANGTFKALLSRWAQANDKPIVLMIDEVDALVGDTLISLLRQLREGYISRPGTPFVHSVILCGVRDVRDYRIKTSHQEIITGGSAFNVKANSMVMGHFTQDELKKLYDQHTTETGQAFDSVIFEELWQDTQGQPWLVNALGHEMTWQDKTARDRQTTITLERYWAARERLIQSRSTHLEQLTDKLKEDRVHSVIGRLLSGEDNLKTIPPEHINYVEDLGLITSRPQLRIANRIYQEVIPRELTWSKQVTLAQEQSWYLTPTNHIDMPKLLKAFQQFFRENSESWIERFDYKEAGPQLLLQAFLQRIINGGGRIHREYGLGRGRTDIYIEWPLDKTQGFQGEVQRIVLELKLLHKSLERTLTEALPQTTGYADQCGANEAHLIVFNRHPNISWDKKVWQRQEQHDGWDIGVWGM